MVSLPFFNYGGICADNEEISKQLLEEAIGLAKEKNVEHIELRHTQYINNGLPAKTSKVSMRLELLHNSEELWDFLPPKLRSQIRRPSKESMYSIFGREEELDKCDVLCIRCHSSYHDNWHKTKRGLLLALCVRAWP